MTVSYTHLDVYKRQEVDDKKWLMKKCNLKENSDISTQQIEQALYQLRGTQSY